MRNYKMDNIRALLIFLVVLGHFLEGSVSLKLSYANEFIYSFHMAVFIFISGCFAKFDPRRIISSYFCPYIILQILYILLYKLYIDTVQIGFHFSVPQFTLWYLPTMAFYCMIIPLIDHKDTRSKLITLAVCMVITLMAGFDGNIGAPFSLGRFFSFLPFFVAGYYFKNSKAMENTEKTAPIRRSVIGAVSLLLIVFLEIFIIKDPSVDQTVMLNIYSYENGGGSLLSKAVLTAVGALWIVFLLCVIPGKKIPVLSEIGKNTFPIYILHGFVIKILIHNNITDLSAPAYLILVSVISAILVLIFGNTFMSKIIKSVFNGQWISAVVRKVKKPNIGK